MGKINLTALNVRKTALAVAKSRKLGYRPCWADVVAEIPPAQVLIRQQPIRHTFAKTRTRSLPNGCSEQYTQTIEPKKSKSATTNRHLFSPTKLKYEEDSLRKRFFQDHPWELARPRVVLETNGQQQKDVDWSTGIVQRGMPLSGESVVQRQLWLLQNIPDITVPQSYDIARKEFYVLRRREETQNRIAAEEAQHMGAQFGMSWNKVSMKIESGIFNDWDKWARDQLIEQLARSAAAAGNPLAAEEDVLSQLNESEAESGAQGTRPGPPSASPRDNIGSAVFQAEQQRRAARTDDLRPAGNLLRDLAG